MQNGESAQIIFGSFEDDARAGSAVDRLEREGVRPQGFSVIAAQRERGDREDFRTESRRMRDLLANMNYAPNLAVEGRDVASAGALPDMLSTGSTMKGLRSALEKAGAPESAAQSFEQTVREDGLLVGVAIEGPIKAGKAEKTLKEQGAIATVTINVPDVTRAD